MVETCAKTVPPPPSMLVAGYFGGGNLGDEAILDAFRTWCGEHLPGARITAVSGDPAATWRKLQVRAIPKNSFRQILSAVRSHDAVVFPGGGILQDSTSLKSLLYYAGLAAAARLFGKGVFFLNQGVGPLNRPIARRLAVRIVTRWATEFTVRDEGAAEALRGIGVPPELVHVTADTTLLLKKELQQSDDNAPRPGEAILIGVSLRPHDTTRFFKRALLDALKLSPGGKKLRILNFQEGTDEETSSEFASTVRLRHPEMPVFTGWSEDPMAYPAPHLVLTSLGRCHVLIGMRLHSLVFSALCGVPFIGLAYDPKVKAFCEEMGQPCVSPGDDGAAGVMAKELDRAASRHSELRGLLRVKVSTRLKALEKAMALFARAAGAAKGPNTLGIPFSTLGFEETLAEIYAAVRERKSRHVVTLNPEMVMLARRDRAFARALRSAEILTADGVGIRIAARAKYGLRLERVTGIDIVERLLAESREKNLGIFLLGAKPEVVSGLVEKLAASPAPPVIAGWQHGYFGEGEEARVVSKIRAARPDILLVGMGAPLQEKWIAGRRDTLGATVMIGVGGCFDALSGAVPRAPAFFRKAGLEWLHRLILQPSRAGRMAALPRFLVAALAEAVRFRLRL